ncbi:MAG: hypothetical protein JNM66_17865 [Bryobacterales bacterium]|nr:hypothetical protein [Bryobacterales bacterium]
MNTTATTAINGCHGFYDRAANAFALYNDALTAVIGPATPGAAGSIQNSQCTVYGTGSSVSASGTDLTLNIRIGLIGSFAATSQKMYVWIVDNGQAGTGWIQTSSWNLITPYTPSLLSSSPAVVNASPQTFSFTGRDQNGAADIDRLYFLVNTTPTTAMNGCHGFYHRATNSLFLYNDALTVAMGPLPAGSAGTLANSQCTIYGTGSGQVSAVGTDLAVNIRIALNGAFAADDKTMFVWITDNSGLGTGWVATSQWPSALQSLRNCLADPANAVCTLPTSTTPYVVKKDQPIRITRSNVTLQGGSSTRKDTKLVRDPSHTGNLIEIDNAVPVSGVKIQNLTVCGSAKKVWNQNPSPGVEVDLGTSPVEVGCPRVQTVCGDMIMRRTKAQQKSPIGSLQETDFSCIDLWVGNVGLPNSPPENGPTDNPFTYQGPYALELNNVDFEDSTGHAVALYATHGTKKVNDVYVHDSAFNYSELTGILYGTNGIIYEYPYCDGYMDATGIEFRNDPNLFAPRNIRIERNTFKNNNTGAMGGGAMRWVGLRNNDFIENYIYPQDGNNGGGTVQFEQCADKIQISNNTFKGPLTFLETEALELYSRNTEIVGNTIYDFANHGIVAASMVETNILSNDIKGNGWGVETGGITVANSFGFRACDAIPRETLNVTVSGNFSDASPAPTYPSSQSHGVFVQSYNYASPGRIKNLMVLSNNSMQHNIDNVRLEWFVELSGYNLGGGWPFSTSVASPAISNPKTLPVNVIPEPFTWPPVPRCRCIGGPTECPEYPPLTKYGSQRAKFRFAASDHVGALGTTANGEVYHRLYQIRGALSIAGDDTNGSGGPANPGICHFIYDVANKVIYLDDANAGLTFPTSLASPVGPGGFDIGGPGTLNPNCKIRAGQSSSWVPIAPASQLPFSRQTVADVNLDIELPSSPAAKYHIYTYAEGVSGGSLPLRDEGLPGWTYMGYWRNYSQ